MTVFASVAAIVGIVFAGCQLRLSVEVDKRQTTANILKGTREAPLLQAIRRLELLKHSGRPIGGSLTEQVIVDRDLVLNVYDSLAIYYKARTLDQCLVKAHSRAALDVVLGLLEYLQDPPESYSRVVRLRDALDSMSCPPIL